jgi:hypothetical protein
VPLETPIDTSLESLLSTGFAVTSEGPPLQSADTVLPTTDGREIRLRRITEPTAEQKSLLQQLGLILPARLERDRECSVDSATA